MNDARQQDDSKTLEERDPALAEETAIVNHQSTTDVSFDQVLQKAAQEPRDPFDDEPACRELMEEIKDLETVRRLVTQRGQQNNPPSQLGQFELLECLGQGGMGQVFKARHARLGKIQVVKLLLDCRLTDQQATARFRQEMRAIGTLSHPNIVAAHHADEIDGVPYLVMDYVDGESLLELLSQQKKVSQSFSVGVACELVRQAALGLQYAHEQGIVHRDIKPGNLMLDQFGVVRILDLGLARIAHQDEDGGYAELTNDSQILGTPDYMSPEQLRSSKNVDPRTDVYALGATLFCLLTGRPPFAGDQPRWNFFDKAMRVMNAPAPDIRELRDDVPEDLATLISKSLQKDPADRVATAGELAEQLRVWSQTPTVTELPGSGGEVSEGSVITDALSPTRNAAQPRPESKSRKHTWKWTASVSLLFVAMLAGVVYKLQLPDGGTLIVECDDPNARIQIQAVQGKMIESLEFSQSGPQAYELSAGTWKLAIEGLDADLFELDQNSMTITKDGKQNLLVQRTDPAPDTQTERSASETGAERHPDGEIVKDTPVRHMDEGLDWSPGPTNQNLAGLALRPAKFSDSFDVGLHLHRATLGIHDQWSSSRPHFDVSPDGKHWIYSTGKELILRDIASQEILALVTGSIENVWTHVEFSPDGKRFAAIDQSDRAGIEIRNLSGRLVSSFHYRDRLHRSSPDVHSPAQIRWLPSGSELLVWNPGRAIIVSASGEVEYSVDLAASEYKFPEAWHYTPTYNMTSAAPSSWRTCVHPNGQHVSFLYGNGKIVQWDFAEGALTEFASVKLAYNQRSGLRWNKDGQRLLVWCTSDKEDQQPVCRLYSSTGEILHEKPTNGWQSAVWSPDGKSILTDRGHILDDKLQQTKQLDPPEGFAVSRIPFWKSTNEVIFANSDKGRYLRSGLLRRFRPSGAEIPTKSVPQPMAVDRATFSSDGDIYSTHISDYEKIQVFHWANSTNPEQPTGTRQHEVDSWGEGCWNQSGAQLVLRGRSGQSVIDLESGLVNVEKFVSDESDRHSVIYSPDGQFLAYYADGEKDQFLIVPQNGAKPIAVEQEKLGIAPIFSDNSRWIVWGSSHPESSTLNLLDLKSSTQEPVEIDLAGHRLQGPAIFSPNSRFLSFIVRRNGGKSTAFNGSSDDGESTEQLVVRNLQTSRESRHPIVWNRTQSPVLSWSNDSSQIFAGDCYQVFEDGSLELEFAVEHDAYVARFMNVTYFTREGNLFVHGGHYLRMIDSHGELLLGGPVAQTLHRPGPFGRTRHRHENQLLLLAQRVDHPFSLAVFNGEQGAFAWNGIAFQDGATLALSAGGNVLDGPKEIDRYLIHSIRYTGGRTIPVTRRQLVQRLQSSEAQQAAFWAIDQGAVSGQETQESVTPEQITKLDFSGNLEVAALELRQLPLFSELQELSLANTTIESIPSLEGLSHLETIDLEACSVKDISGLANLSSVKVLNLGQTAIQPKAGATLATLKNLESLNLSETVIDRFTLLDLTSLKNLKELILFDVDVTQADIEQFQQELPNCRVRVNEETQRPTDAS